MQTAKKGIIKPKEGGGERKDGCHLKQANFFFPKKSNPGHVLSQLGSVCMVCVCVCAGERRRDESALINKPPVQLVACNNYLVCCISFLEGQFNHSVFLKNGEFPCFSATACHEFIWNETTEIAMTSPLNILLERALMKNKSCEEKKTNGQINRGKSSEIKVSAVCQRATGSHSRVDCT